MIIREGRRYWDRENGKHGPFRPTGDPDYPWWNWEGSWKANGRWIGDDEESYLDLIAEVDEAAPATPQPNDFLDRAALAALTGLLASETESSSYTNEWAAERAYDLATALSSERAKRLAARTDSRDGEG